MATHEQQSDRLSAWPYAGGRILNMSTGPVEVSRNVLDAQLVPLLTSHVPDFWAVHDETIGLLKQVLRTTGNVVATQGSIRAGLDIALGNFVRPGMRVLCLENGFWGHMLGDWAESRGGEVTRLEFDFLSPIEPREVAKALLSSHYDIVTMVHVETNAGIVNPVEEIGAIIRHTPSLFFVDTACSAGAIPVETDAWGIDIGVTGSHKCLSSVPGLTILTISDKALRVLPEKPVMGNFFSIRELIRHTNERPVTPPFTQSPPLFYALRESLRAICTIGIEKWWTIHQEVADLFIAKLRQSGFGLLLDKGPVAGDKRFQSAAVIAAAYPKGVEDAAFRQTLYDQFGIFVIGNVGRFAGESFRVGLMSPPQLEAVNAYGAVAAFSATADLVKAEAEPLRRKI